MATTTRTRTILRWLLAAAYLIAGIAHLAIPHPFLGITPAWVPFPEQVIMATGVCEIAGAAALLTTRLRWWAGVLLAAYAVCVYPANVKHAIDQVLVAGQMHSLYYHVPRLLFQPVIVWWALFAGQVTDWPFRRTIPGSKEDVPEPALTQHTCDTCICDSLADLAAVPIGGDGLDERVLASIDIVHNHGGGLWWLYLSRCHVCGQNWMIAQEERIFDEYFLKRLDPAEAEAIVALDRWPENFITYERVLKIGRSMSTPCIFFDKYSPSLRDTVQDLRKERPEISNEEISYLLGISPKIVARLAMPI